MLGRERGPPAEGAGRKTTHAETPASCSPLMGPAQSCLGARPLGNTDNDLKSDAAKASLWVELSKRSLEFPLHKKPSLTVQQLGKFAGFTLSFFFFKCEIKGLIRRENKRSFCQNQSLLWSCLE